jgi:hypothetical protein
MKAGTTSMTIPEFRAIVNTALIFLVLVLNTLYSSEIGGSESVYNKISFILVALLLVVNRSVDKTLFLAFVVPIIFIFLSVLVNSSSLEAGGFRSALAAAAGYLLLAQGSLSVNQKLMRQLINLYLTVSLVVSIYWVWSSDGSLNIAGNSNFNINPNAASIFFLTCLIFVLIFTDPPFKFPFATSFTMLILTTGSRAGFVSLIVLWTGWLIFGNNRKLSFRNTVFSKSMLYVVSVVSAILFIVTFIFPDAVEYLFLRLTDQGLAFSSDGGTGRLDIWQHAQEISSLSLTSLLFGHGPASATELMGIGTHGSYIEAITSVGWPFLISTLVALIILFLHHLKLGQKEVLVYGVVILMYGSVETILFNGVGTLWYVFIMISIYYRSLVISANNDARAADWQGNHVYSHS